jgi:arsenite-transporting ATPase
MAAMKDINVFAGKGGVGKTTCAAATALYLSSQGRRTLCLSTDPTPSLFHIFEIGSKALVDGLAASLCIREIGEEETKEMWNKKFGPEVYEVFSSFVSISYPEFTEFMVSILPGLRDEFMVDYSRQLSIRNEYDAIVWDTAPLGQTLALLETPAMLAEHLRLAPRIYSRLKVGKKSKEPVLEIIKRWDDLSSANMAFLRESVNFNLVTIPEALAVNQLDYIFAEMGKYGLGIDRLIINNIVRPDASEFLTARAHQQKRYLDAMHRKYSALRIAELPLFPFEIKGISRLREVCKYLFA